jgi:BirA family biotin operon repressor/biotin-[acetyl-CoA-carboxylase] ligase
VSIRYNVLSFGRIPSTQTLAAEMIARGEAADKTVVIAESQSAGRGRGRRKWVSRRGNLYASFVYKADERRPAPSYAFAVAAAESLLALGVPARIKWPNDLLADGKKISGMLLEYCGGFLIVGIGINIATKPPLESYGTAKTDEYAKGLTPATIASELIKNFEKWRGAGDVAIRGRWLELSIDLGSPVVHRNRAAIYCGLNEDGAMLLRIGSRYELVYGDEMLVQATVLERANPEKNSARPIRKTTIKTPAQQRRAAKSARPLKT